MDMESTCVEPLLEDWLQNIHDSNNEQICSIKEGTSYYVPYIGVPAPAMRTIFSVANCLNLDPYVKYLAVHIFDRFMCNTFWEILKLDKEGHLEDNSWPEISARLSSQSKLYLLSCIQLASKVDSHTNGLTVSQIRVILQYLDPKSTYTNLDFVFSEIKVLKTLNWTIPSYTPISCIEVLLAVTGLQNMPGIIKAVNCVLDVAYLMHDELYTRLQILAQKQKHKTDRKNRIILEANVLFLAASVVLCTMYFMSVDDKTWTFTASELAYITNIIVEDIETFAKLLFQMIMEK